MHFIGLHLNYLLSISQLYIFEGQKLIAFIQNLKCLTTQSIIQGGGFYKFLILVTVKGVTL